MAVDEANAGGGVLGRQVQLITEDSVNPGVATQKAQKLIEGDKAACLIGEISSASALAIAEVANRAQVVYVNTGSNSDQLRGSNCNRFMFHVEGCNTMYTKTIGLWQQRQGLIDGAKWYFLTADYAFGHDLYRVSSKFLEENGGINLGNDMVPTNTLDYSAYILKIRQAGPDFVYLNLAGVDQTTFLKQYREYGLDYPLAGGVMDTGPFWAAGLEIALGPLAEPVVPRARHRGLAGVHAEVHRAQRQAAREPGLGRVRRHADPAQGDRRDRRHRQHGDRASIWRAAPSSTF